MGMLDDRVCVITGGAGSIGLATAGLFLAEGGRVALVDRDAGALDAAVASLGSDRVIAHAADVGSADDTRAYVEAAFGRWGRIDVLFCNAGTSGPIAPIADYPEDAFDAVYRANVKGSFLACKYGLPHMGAGGSVIIMSSIAGLGGTAGVYAYCTAKHAQIGLMRSLAKEVAGRGIRVNSLHPGPVDNGFQLEIERAFSPLIGGGDATAMMDSLIPLGRHARPEEVARSALYLASDMSSFTTGSTMVVDGGFTA